MRLPILLMLSVLVFVLTMPVVLAQQQPKPIYKIDPMTGTVWIDWVEVNRLVHLPSCRENPESCQFAFVMEAIRYGNWKTLDK